MNALISEYLLYGDLDEEKLADISGFMIDRKGGRLADLTYEEELPIGVMPKKPIFKMSKREHVDAFFDRGTLQLGNFDYFSKSENEEVGDKTEGSFVLVGRCPGRTGFTKISGGFNFHVFCAFEGDADPSCIKKFDYDSYFEIMDIIGFQKAISARIRSSNAKYSRCIYKRDKALVGKVPEDFNFMTISSKQLDFVNSAKYFLKPNKFSHQNEFRFIWEVKEKLESPTIIECPEAIKFCRKPKSEPVGR